LQPDCKFGLGDSGLVQGVVYVGVCRVFRVGFAFYVLDFLQGVHDFREGCWCEVFADCAGGFVFASVAEGDDGVVADGFLLELEYEHGHFGLAPCAFGEIFGVDHCFCAVVNRELSP